MVDKEKTLHFSSQRLKMWKEMRECVYEQERHDKYDILFFVIAVSLAFHLTLNDSVSYWMQYNQCLVKYNSFFPLLSQPLGTQTLALSFSLTHTLSYMHNCSFILSCKCSIAISIGPLLLAKKKISNHGFRHCEWWRWWCKCKSQKQSKGFVDI